ncbi:GTP pyrophosphokinase [Nocardia rhamnosiphila]
MDVIEEFIARYVKEYDFYETAARLAKEIIESGLQAAGVPCIVTHRAKSVTRLEAKCRGRIEKKGYQSVEDIFDDIVDLAGVRVALYFPAEREQVDKLVTNKFLLLESRKEFPEKKDEEEAGDSIANDRAGKFEKRFSGYSAVHYRVQLKESDLPEPDKRYAIARVEIQVASVLMHAWSEVEHDLVYKPVGGDLGDPLSEDEHALLDQLNGLVHSGEIALERLQKAGERRIDETQRKFRNHFELAAYLLSHMRNMTSQPVSDSGLGRVDHLFEFLKQIGTDTPQQLIPYLEVLHGNLELRSLAEQVVDALLAQDQDRYEIYRSVLAENQQPTFEDDSREAYYLIGNFIAEWGRLEHLVRGLFGDTAPAPAPLLVVLRKSSAEESLGSSLYSQIDDLRRIRNNLVHRGHRGYDVESLESALFRLKSVLAEMRHRFGDPEID